MEDLLRVREWVSVCVTSSSPPSSASFGTLNIGGPTSSRPTRPSFCLPHRIALSTHSCALACLLPRAVLNATAGWRSQT